MKAEPMNLSEKLGASYCLETTTREFLGEVTLAKLNTLPETDRCLNCGKPVGKPVESQGTTFGLWQCS